MSPTSVVCGSEQQLHSVFVYGSLLADDVVRVLLRRVPQSSTALLHGYHRFKIKDRVYPAILPVESKKVTGRVLMGITTPELDILDTFEDDEYERSVVEVTLENLQKLQAYTYVWSNKDDPKLYGEWSFEEWKPVHMEGFVKMTTGFMEEMELPEAKARVTTYETFYSQDVKDSATS